MISRNKIHRLKQQPRHGRGLLDDLMGIGEAGSAAAASFVKLETAYKNLNESSNNVVRGFERQQAVNQQLISSFEGAAKASLYLELRNKDLQKAFGTNSLIAAKLSENVQKIATRFGFAGKEAQKYAGAIKKIAPTLDQITVKNQNYLDGLMGVQRILTTNLGLTEDQAASYTGLATQNGKNAVEMLKTTEQLASFLDPTGAMGYFKMITEGLAETTEDLQLQYGKIPNNLALATLRAKSLGLSIEQITSAGESLLDIESSIGSELEYQLLSGRRLIDQQGKSLTNTFREATLRGDAAEQANTLNKILEQEGETLENNLFARQQMSSLLGMDEASLSRALQKKKLLEESGAEVLFDLEGDELKKAAESMVANGAIAEDTFNKIVELSDTRTTDEKMVEQLTAVAENTSVLKSGQAAAVAGVQTSLDAIVKGPMKEAMINMTEGALESIGKTLTTVDLVKSITVQTVKDLFINAKTPEMTSVATGDDAVIPAGYGSRILSFPENTLQAPIAFNDDDTIVAGTNLSRGGGNMSQQSAAMIVAAIERQTAALRAGLFQERGINTPLY
jgi:hypothetical protein